MNSELELELECVESIKSDIKIKSKKQYCQSATVILF